jgi:hypothetical protein
LESLVKFSENNLTNLNKTTAILLFSRTAYAEAQAKPLIIGKNKAEKVAAIAIQQFKAGERWRSSFFYFGFWLQTSYYGIFQPLRAP